VLRTEVEAGDSVGGAAAAAKSCRRSTGMVTLAARRVTIGWVLWGHAQQRRGGRPMARHRGRISSLVHQGAARWRPALWWLDREEEERARFRERKLWIPC
jgi:hypothetical protein